MSIASEDKKVQKRSDGHPSVELSDFSMFVGKQRLLQDVNLEIPAGKVTLVVGRSGAGKSVLMRVLAGLHEESEDGIHTQGEVAIAGRPLAEHAESQIGVVFQSFALLDEFSPSENVKLAESHRGPNARCPESTGELLDELHVPRNRRVTYLSGGQKQRLAIARTLAQGAPVILYDEPTSGLDASTADQVATLIRKTNDQHEKTSIIVTHDYRSLLPIADEIILLDPASQSLTRVPKEEWDSLSGLLGHPPKTSQDHASESLVEKATAKATNFFSGTTDVVAQTASLPWMLLPLFRSPYWAFRFFTHYAHLVAGPSAWLYLGLTGAITGFVTTYFTFKFLPRAEYTEPLFLEEVLQAVGFILFRVLIPIISTLLIAARCGAAVTSDVAAKSYGNQLDGMRSLGASPFRYLATTIVYSFLIGVPVLFSVAYFCASVCSMISFAALYPDLGLEYWGHHYHYRLVQQDTVFFGGSWWLLGKLTVSALAISLVSYYRGVSPKASSREISKSITTTILWSTILVMATHFVFAFLEF